MFRGMGEKAAVAGLALLTATTFAAPASAADLGSDCCADLEERVAELEATAARKGNRVVSLQVSGAVTQAILSWDNGDESDTYVVGPTGLSHLTFAGTGKISETLTAGFRTTLFIWSEAQFLVNENSDEGAGIFSDGLQIAWNELYLEDSRLGRVTIGQGSGATDYITSINVANSAFVRSSGAQLYNGAFNTSQGYVFRDLFGSAPTQAIGEGTRYDRIRYDSPTIAGFKLSASWGEDDYWDAALRYSGLVAGRIKFGAGVGYGAFKGDSDEDNGCADGDAGAKVDIDCWQVGASAGALDVPTGLFAHVSYGFKKDELIRDVVGLGIGEGDRESLYIQAGIEKNWFGHGATTLFGEYQTTDIGLTGSFLEGEATVWGFGAVQKYDAAGLDLFATYRNISSESTPLGAAASVENEDWNEVFAGGRIQF